jgi:hypothetical protein
MLYEFSWEARLPPMVWLITFADAIRLARKPEIDTRLLCGLSGTRPRADLALLIQPTRLDSVLECVPAVADGTKAAIANVAIRAARMGIASRRGAGEGCIGTSFTCGGHVGS